MASIIPTAPPSLHAAGDTDDAGCLHPHAFRKLIATALAATVWLTWPLWQTRETPPLLPLFRLPQLDMGWPLVAACVALAVFPRAGLAACWLAFAWAILSDQTRLQPEIPSMLLLAFGTVGSSGGVLVARASLVSLWLFAGVHKLFSQDFYTVLMPWLLGGSWRGAWGHAAGASLASSEILLALGCVLPETRKAAAALGFALHAGILLLLSPAFLDWNEAVWPWNVVLACAGPAIVLPWKGRGFGGLWKTSPGWAKGWAAALMLMPIGYWLGIVDANLAACVYANNTPRAFVCTVFSRTPINAFCDELNVPLPPAHRLYRPFFLGVGSHGTWLEIDDPRCIAGLLGFDRTKVFWIDLLPADIEIPADTETTAH